MIVQDTGEIWYGHCTCMAGLGETCTHIAAVLFYVEAKARLAGSSTCTQKKCQWIIPSYTKDLPYLTISDIHFASAAAKKKNLDDAVGQALEPYSSKMNLKKTTSKEPTSEEMELLYKELSECGTKPGILSFISPYVCAKCNRTDVSKTIAVTI